MSSLQSVAMVGRGDLTRGGNGHGLGEMQDAADHAGCNHEATMTRDQSRERVAQNDG